MSMITAVQIRMARAALDWSQADLARASGVPLNTIWRVERKQTRPRRATLDALRAALESAGVRWTDAGGVEPAG